nr:immunoglobulin heavy chain junction region [Mus musculus]NSM05145.1 immunoglobulin heavy chain junction region [Mus musculus]NSM06264.1 immunoglobulin heavy chain junction region [Mus musculus]NSM07190.1 immunoglobulin heavy chain junction region [Mus musculus]NSM08618.1 immunoglobulin heavy chain junction region [Mus musculus]
CAKEGRQLRLRNWFAYW